MNRVQTKRIRAPAQSRSNASRRTRRPHDGSVSVHEPVRAERRIRIKRAYEPASAGDGHRVLVDRMWPRGVSRQALRLHLWLQEIAPSPALRKWFGHDPARWREFRALYARELREKRGEFAVLERLVRDGLVTLVYAARDKQHNHALVLAEELADTLKRNNTVERHVALGCHGSP